MMTAKHSEKSLFLTASSLLTESRDERCYGIGAPKIRERVRTSGILHIMDLVNPTPDSERSHCNSINPPITYRRYKTNFTVNTRGLNGIPTFWGSPSAEDPHPVSSYSRTKTRCPYGIPTSPPDRQLTYRDLAEATCSRAMGWR